jgi:hypothetical protein
MPASEGEHAKGRSPKAPARWADDLERVDPAELIEDSG